MVKYVFVCAGSRTGSTLLDMILGGHSMGASLGEFSYLGKAIALDQVCGCGERVSECSQWHKLYEQVRTDTGKDLLATPYSMMQWDTRAGVVIDKYQQTWFYVQASRFRSFLTRLKYSNLLPFDLSLPTSLQQGVKNSIYLYGAVLSNWGKNFIIDSSKNVFKAISVYKAATNSTKIILLTRDGRGVLNSHLKSGISRKKALRDWYGYYSRAFYYLEKNVDSNDYMIIKYEDLVSDLEGQLTTLCKWLEVPFEKNMLDLTLGDRHLVNGNLTMYRRSHGVSFDDSWITELDKPDLDWFLSRAGSLNRKLGYD